MPLPASWLNMPMSHISLLNSVYWCASDWSYRPKPVFLSLVKHMALILGCLNLNKYYTSYQQLYHINWSSFSTYFTGVMPQSTIWIHIWSCLNCCLWAWTSNFLEGVNTFLQSPLGRRKFIAGSPEWCYAWTCCDLDLWLMDLQFFKKTLNSP